MGVLDIMHGRSRMAIQRGKGSTVATTKVAGASGTAVTLGSQHSEIRHVHIPRNTHLFKRHTWVMYTRRITHHSFPLLRTRISDSMPAAVGLETSGSPRFAVRT